jgi:uncharacterized protein YqfA (UPF0365 family)
MVIAQAEHLPFVLAGVVSVVICLVILVVTIRVVPPWLQARLSAVPLSVFDIIAMRFRKTDVRAVIQALVMARQAGVSLSVAEVERAYLQGVDLEKVVLAFIRAKKDDMDLTFEQLLDADRYNRLEKKLEGR